VACSVTSRSRTSSPVDDMTCKTPMSSGLVPLALDKTCRDVVALPFLLVLVLAMISPPIRVFNRSADGCGAEPVVGRTITIDRSLTLGLPISMDVSASTMPGILAN